MTFSAGVTIGLVALVVLLSIPQIGAWWRRHRRGRSNHPSTSRTEECEVCGAEISIVVAHLVTTSFDDDGLLGGATPFGGTVMSAAYCSNHCPGGCNQPARPGRVVH